MYKKIPLKDGTFRGIFNMYSLIKIAKNIVIVN